MIKIVLYEDYGLEGFIVNSYFKRKKKIFIKKILSGFARQRENPKCL